MSTSKEDIKMDKLVDFLKNSEDDGTFYNTIYNLYLFIEIKKGVNDARNGNSLTLEEFNKERETLYESYNRKFG